MYIHIQELELQNRHEELENLDPITIAFNDDKLTIAQQAGVVACVAGPVLGLGLVYLGTFAMVSSCEVKDNNFVNGCPAYWAVNVGFCVIGVWTLSVGAFLGYQLHKLNKDRLYSNV